MGLLAMGAGRMRDRGRGCFRLRALVVVSVLATSMFAGVGWTGGRWAEPVGAAPRASGSSAGRVAIAAGGSHSCVLLAAGTVKCWGLNGSGQLGNNSTTNS